MVELQDFNSWYAQNKPRFISDCEAALEYMEECKSRGITPPKFPTPCRSCWKVLVFELPEIQARALWRRYDRFLGAKDTSSKYREMKGSPGKYLVVIYTKSESQRDKVIREIRSDQEFSGRIAYRFACREFQELFPEMFISAGKPNPKYL